MATYVFVLSDYMSIILQCFHFVSLILVASAIIILISLIALLILNRYKLNILFKQLLFIMLSMILFCFIYSSYWILAAKYSHLFPALSPGIGRYYQFPINDLTFYYFENDKHACVIQFPNLCLTDIYSANGYIYGSNGHIRYKIDSTEKTFVQIKEFPKGIHPVDFHLMMSRVWSNRFGLGEIVISLYGILHAIFLILVSFHKSGK